MVADTNVVRKPTDAKGLTSIFDVKVVKVRTVTAVNGPGCDSLFVNLEYIRPVDHTERQPLPSAVHQTVL